MLNKARLPKEWDKDFAYFFGLLLGDGSVPITSSLRTNGKKQKRYHIYFISDSLEFIKKIYQPLFIKLFDIHPYIECRKKDRLNVCYNCRIESKQVYEFLKKQGFIIGRKAKIAKVPKIPEDLEIHVLAGLLDTDGGKKSSGFGFSTASEHLASFCIKMFKKLDLSFHSCPWVYNNHQYHQIYIHKKDFKKILELIPIKNKYHILFINSRLSSSAG